MEIHNKKISKYHDFSLHFSSVPIFNLTCKKKSFNRLCFTLEIYPSRKFVYTKFIVPKNPFDSCHRWTPTVTNNCMTLHNVENAMFQIKELQSIMVYQAKLGEPSMYHWSIKTIFIKLLLRTKDY